MKFNTVIAAVSIEDDLTEGVIRTAQSLAQKDNAALHIVSAWPLLTAAAYVHASDIAAGSAVLSQAAVERNREAREKNEEKLKAMTAQWAPGASCRLLDGETADAVAHYAEEIGADLLVTGSHQRDFWGALFQGASSRDLVRESPCAVFLVTKAFAQKLPK